MPGVLDSLWAEDAALLKIFVKFLAWIVCVVLFKLTFKFWGCSGVMDKRSSEHHFELSYNLNLRRSLIDEFSSSLVSEVILTFFRFDNISVKSICW